MHPYYCKECGAEVIVTGEGVTRTCGHSGATIVAERSSNLFGEGGAAQSLTERAAQALRKIFTAFS